MRGKDISAALVMHSWGITPAYAGKSHSVQCNGQQTEDHPRLCGEKFSGTLTPKTDSGSPPPMRGKDRTAFDLVLCVGITPAYAGKSSAFIRSSPVNQDHPRLCGEKLPFLRRRG